MASGQEVRYVVYVDGMGRVVSGFQQGEAAATSMERSIAGVNSSLRELGIAIGAYQLFDFAKGMVQDAADFEKMMLRIKNASQDASTGIKNQLFIGKEADDFKEKLDEVGEHYSKFLFKIKNAHLTNDQKNNIFNEILAIGKVGGLSSNQMESTIFQLSTLLGEGVLDARHLRQLGNVHPNLMPYIADELGLKDKQKDAFIKLLHTNEEDTTALQKLYQLMSSTKLTKLGINSLEVLPHALDRYYADIKDKVPETLGLIQSGINEISTAWARFDNEIIQKLKPELTELFIDIKDGISWIKDHEDGIIVFGKILKDVAEIWLAYKVTTGLINLGQTAYISISNLFSESIVKETTAATGLNAELLLMNEQMRILINLQVELAMSANAISHANMLNIKSYVNQEGGYGAGVVAGGERALSTGAIIPTITSILGTAAIAAAVIAIVDRVGTEKGWFGTGVGEHKKSIRDVSGVGDWNETPGGLLDHFGLKSASEVKPFLDKYIKIHGDTEALLSESELQTMHWMEWIAEHNTNAKLNANGEYTLGETTNSGRPGKDAFNSPYKSLMDLHNEKNKSKTPTPNYGLDSDKIKGNHPVTYNYYIHEMNGQKFDKQIINKGGDIDIQDIGNKVAQVLESVTYNSQQGGN